MSIVEKEDGFRYREMHNGGLAKLCSAIVNEQPCGHSAINGKDYCGLHGGKNPIAALAPSFKHGLRSKDKERFAKIGTTLLTRINELRDDPELFNLRDDAAYMTALIDQRAETANEGLGIKTLHDLRALYSAAKSAYRAGELDEFQNAFKSMGDLINEATGASKATEEVIELIGKRVGIIEAEQRMAHVKAYTLEVDQAYSLIHQVLDVIKKSVHNADELTAIKAGFGRLLRVYKSSEEQGIIDAEVVDEEE
jgi:hypothetical protein